MFKPRCHCYEVLVFLSAANACDLLVLRVLGLGYICIFMIRKRQGPHSEAPASPPVSPYDWLTMARSVHSSATQSRSGVSVISTCMSHAR